MKSRSTRLSQFSMWLLVAALGLAACSPGATAVPTAVPPTAAPTVAPTAAATAVAEASLKLATDATLGQFLADSSGRTLYMFTKDSPNISNCYDKCAQFWPPLLTLGQPKLADGMNQALIGTTPRKDGTTQLTYNSWPLYYFAKDKAAGDTTGQGSQNTWWVLSAEGNPIKPAGLGLKTDPKLGKFLVDDAGNTLYLFTKDTKNTTVCYGKCEQAWPPLLSLGQPKLGDGLDATLIGTTQRKDGTTQLTYNGWPLYYYYEDSAPGDTAGQAVQKVWWVTSSEGNPIRPGSLAITSTTTLGKFLTDSAGRTVYIYTKDTKDTSVCYGKCEQFWPPLLTLDKPVLGEGVDASLLGTASRKDGTAQVTYNGAPLYYYAKDAAPGDTTGQGVQQVWYVLTPTGTVVNP